MNVTIALLSLAVVPFLYLCLRYYTSTLVSREERVKELESKLLERLYETLRRDAAGQELRARAARAERYARAGDEDDGRADRDHLAAVALLGRRQHHHDPRHRARRHRRRPARDARPDDRRPVCTSSSPISARCTDRCRRSRTRTGQLQGALAGAKRVRAMFALMPETVDAPDAVDASRHQGRRPLRGRRLRLPRRHQRPARHHVFGRGPARWSRSSV